VSRSAPLLVLVGSVIAVVLTHPEPFTGWGVWALAPFYVFWLALLTRRGVKSVGGVAAGYALVFAFVAGVGDESYTDVARGVYIALPLLALLIVVVVFVSVAASSRRTGTVPPRQATIALGAALAVVWAVAAQLAAPETVVAEVGSRAPARVAVVRCDGDDTLLLTPVVRVQSDGVHVRVRNETGHEVEIGIDIDGGAGGGGGQVIPAGTSALVVPFSASTVGFACLDERPSTSEYATARVVDPGNVARPPELNCSSTRREILEEKQTMDRIRTARDVFVSHGVFRPGDTVVPAVPIAGEFPVALLVRDDRAIASVSFQQLDLAGRSVPTDLEVCAD
jgi:hypothetical protein